MFEFAGAASRDEIGGWSCGWPREMACGSIAGSCGSGLLVMDVLPTLILGVMTASPVVMRRRRMALMHTAFGPLSCCRVVRCSRRLMVVLMESEPLDLSPNGPSAKNVRTCPI